MGSKKPIGMIRVEDIAQIRNEMYIGKVLEEKIYFDKLGERLMRPKVKVVEVCGIYPYMVAVKEKGQPEKLPGQTITYVDLLLRQVKEARGEEDV